MKREVNEKRILEDLEYNPETGSIKWRKGWRNAKEAGCIDVISRVGYRKISIDGISKGAHRIAWFMYYGSWPEGDIDHINGDGLDNRIANLRCVTDEENQKNRRISSNNKSGVCGVYFDKRSSKWTAAIHANGKPVRIGSFDSFEDAVNARKDREKEFGYAQSHGEKRSSCSHVTVKKACDRIRYQKKDGVWVSTCRIEGKEFHIGSFASREEAMAARQNVIEGVVDKFHYRKRKPRNEETS